MLSDSTVESTHSVRRKLTIEDLCEPNDPFILAKRFIEWYGKLEYKNGNWHEFKESGERVRIDEKQVKILLFAFITRHLYSAGYRPVKRPLAHPRMMSSVMRCLRGYSLVEF